jgi:hypothetical protein
VRAPGSAGSCSGDGPPTTTTSASGHPAHGLDDVAEALALDQPADRQDAGALRVALDGRAVRGEPVAVHAGRHDGQLRPRHADAHQTAYLVLALRDHAVDRAAERPLVAGPRRLAAAPSTRPSSWNDCTTGMPTWRAAVTAARPLVQKWACTTSAPVAVPPLLAEPVRELAHVRQQQVGRDRGPGRPARAPRDAARHGDHVGQARVVAAGVDADLVAELGQRGGQVGDVGLLAAVTQRAGVLGDHRDAHGFLRVGRR